MGSPSAYNEPLRRLMSNDRSESQAPPRLAEILLKRVNETQPYQALIESNFDLAIHDLNLYFLKVGLYTASDEEYLLKMLEQTRGEQLPARRKFINCIKGFLMRIKDDCLIEEVSLNIFNAWMRQ
jgi:hypothetical protein